MTKPLTAVSQEAQRLTEDAKKDLLSSVGIQASLCVEALAKKIIPLVEKSELNPTPNTLVERCTILPEPSTTTPTEEYAQKCVLTCPDLFPYFVQLYPKLHRTVEDVIDRYLGDEQNCSGIINQLGPIYDSITLSDDLISLIVYKIGRKCKDSRAVYYIWLVQLFNSEGHVTNYVINCSNANALLARKTAEYELNRSPLQPSKICALLSAYAKAQGWECLPLAIESQILEMDPAHQKASLVWMTRFFQSCEGEQISPQEFACFVKSPFLYAGLGRPDLRADCNFSYVLLKLARIEVENGYAKEALKSFKWDAHNHSILILPFLSVIHSQGVSKEACDTLLKQICTSQLESRHLSICFRVLGYISDLSVNFDLSREDKEYLLQRISEEPSLMPCMRMIAMIGGSDKMRSLKKVNFENRTFASALKAIFKKNDDPLLEAAQCSTKAQTEKDPAIAQMTAEILTSGGFKKDEARDNYEAEYEITLPRPLNGGQTIAQVQGCIAFCEKTLQYAIKIPSVLSHSSLRAAQDADINTALALRYKRLGHAFSLRGMVKLPNGTQVSLDGFNETFVIPMLRAAFDEFAALRPDLISASLGKFVKESLSNATWHENTENLDPNYPVASGWSWHSTQAFFHNGYLYYGNRGADCGEKSGISILEIGNKEKITPEFLKQIASRLSVDKSDYISLEKIKEKLSAVEVAHIPMKGQKVGNCVYANAKALVYALLLVGVSAKKTPPFTQETKASAEKIYKEFFRFDKAADLEDFLIDLEQATTGKFDTEAGRNYLEGVGKIASLLKTWILNHTRKQPKVGRDLLAKTLELICLRDWD